MKKNVIIGIMLATVMGASGAANAQSIQFGRDGVRIIPPGFEESYRYRDERVHRRGISERQAIRIARQNGLRDVERVNSRRNSIRVVGYDRRDDRISVVVDRYSGNVINVQRRG